MILVKAYMVKCCSIKPGMGNLQSFRYFFFLKKKAVVTEEGLVGEGGCKLIALQSLNVDTIVV